MEMTMTAMLSDFSEPLVVAARSRAEAFIAETRFERPTLVIDTEAVARLRARYERLGLLGRNEPAPPTATVVPLAMGLMQ